MHLQRLRVRNWCQFREFEMEFSPGLTFLVGPNGSGKSNALGAIRWLLTGENPNEGVMAENICQEAPESEAADGSLWLTHRGQEVMITKYLRPEKKKSTLHVNGKQEALGERDVCAKLFELLGMDGGAINRFLLIAQSDIFGILAEQPETRSKTLQKLFDTGFAAELADLTAKHDNGITLTDYQPQIDAVRQQITKAEEALATARASLATAGDPAELQKTFENNVRIVTIWQQRQKAEPELVNRRALVWGNETRLETQRATLAQLEADLVSLDEAASGSRDAADRATTALADIARYEQVQKQKTAIETRIKTINASLQALTVPQYPDFGSDIAAISAEYDTVARDLATNASFLKQWATTGLTECPTCGQPVAVLASKVESIQAVQPTKQARYVELQGQLKALRDYDAAQILYNSNRTQLEAQRSQAQAQLAGLAAATPTTGSPAELQAAVSTYAEYRTGADTLRPWINTLKGEIAQLEGLLAAQRPQLLELETWLANCTVTAIDAEAAQRNTTAAQELLTQINTLSRAESAAAAALTTQQTSLADLERRAAESEKTRRWLTEGEEVRSVLKLLPKLIAQDSLRQLEATINEMLGICAANFRLSANETLSFTGHFHNGRTQNARRFSGGQKVLTAMLFRIAVVLRFAANIGFLGLDEPTTFLDKKSVAAFRPLFERLRDMMAQRGLQCFIITHEEELAPLADKVTTLAVR